MIQKRARTIASNGSAGRRDCPHQNGELNRIIGKLIFKDDSRRSHDSVKIIDS